MTDIETQRSILLSARLQLSPQTENPRREAIDRLVLTSLLAAPEGTQLTADHIEATGLLDLEDGRPAITRSELENALDRLSDADKVVTTDLGTKTLYKLSQSSRQRLEETRRASERQFEAVLRDLFTLEDAELQKYGEAFREAISLLLGQLSEANILRILGKGEEAPPLTPGSVAMVAKRVSRHREEVDPSYLRQRIFKFFESSDPRYNELKWRYAQNEFVIKALGLDEAGFSLSKELFGQSVFYIDTNVLIHALEPLARHYQGFHAVRDVSDDLEIELCVARISVDECRGVAAHKSDLIADVRKQIPPETRDKVGDLFYRIFKDRVLHGESSFAEAFSRLTEPDDEIAEFDVTIVEDDWFEIEVSAEATERLQSKLETESGKDPRQARHDALMLRWVNRQRREGNRGAWLLTTDTELPRYSAEGSSKSLAVTLDGFLQWLGTVRGGDGKNVSGLFANEVRRLLEQTDRFFKPGDFRIFARMGMECQELPAADVEECVRTLKQEGFDLSPNNPQDRLELMSRISQFFATSDLEYKYELRRLEGKLAEKEEEREELENELEGESERAEREAAGREAAELRAQAYGRLLISFGVAGLLILVVAEVILPNVSGENFVQRIISSWPLLGALGAGWVTATLWWLGADRIRAIGREWPIVRRLVTHVDQTGD